jgi:hypothetical protein
MLNPTQLMEQVCGSNNTEITVEPVGKSWNAGFFHLKRQKGFSNPNCFNFFWNLFNIICCLCIFPSPIFNSTTLICSKGPGFIPLFDILFASLLGI